MVVTEMVKTKKTSRHSDLKGNLPPLAPRRVNKDWGMAAETFHHCLQLLQDPARWDVSYKVDKLCQTCQTVYSNAYVCAV